MSNYIGSIGTGGHPDGGVYAINPSGDLVSTKLIPLKGGAVGLKPGWRAATADDIAAKHAAEAARKAPAVARPAAKKGD